MSWLDPEMLQKLGVALSMGMQFLASILVGFFLGRWGGEALGSASIGTLVGIFLGLSESPILLQILIPLLTVIVGLLSILTGQKSDEKPTTNETTFLGNKNISPFPIMWVVLGMVAGSFMGLLAKNYDITGRGEMFGHATSKSVSTTKLVEREPRKDADHIKSSTVLHGISEELCEQQNLCNLNGLELLCALKDIENPEVEEMLSKNELNLDSVKYKINISCNCQK